MGLKIYAKKSFLLLFPLFFLTAGVAWSQCLNSDAFGTATAPTSPAPITITTCAFAGEFSTVNGAVAGETYLFTGSGGAGNYLTIRQGTSGGTVLAHGPSPVSATVTVSGPIFVHVNTNAACGTDGSCHTLTVACSSCPLPPDACTTMVPIVCGVPAVTNHSGAGLWNVTTCGFNTPGQERIYSFTATVTGTHSLQVLSAAGGFMDYYWRTAASGCGPTGWTCIDDISGAATRTIGTLTEGTTYYFLVDAEGTGSFSHTFQINCPVYNPCTTIPVLTCGTSTTVTATGTGVWSPTGSCGFLTPGREKLFSFTPVTTGVHDLNITAASGGYGDWYIKAASSGCNATGWTCIDDVDSPTTISLGALTAGTTYYIMMDAETITTISQTFEVVCPPYDPCAIVTNLTCATPVTSTHLGTGVWDNFACLFNTPGLERLYTFTPNVTGVHSLRVNSATGGYIDYYYKEVSDGCTSTGWTCIDDNNAAGTDVIGTLTAGTQYYILLDPEAITAMTHTFQINEPELPTITCPANITANNTTGACSASLATPAPVRADNCAVTRLTWALTGATVASSAATGINVLPTRNYNVGVTTVTYTVADGSGNTAVCSFTVTVSDTQAPTLTCPANITVSNGAGLCAASVAVPNLTNADNCAVTVRTWTMSGATTGASPLTGLNNVGTQTFNVGVTTIQYNIRDAAGNTNTCSFTVTVNDTQPPAITCPTVPATTTAIGSCTAVVNYTVTATDNCPGVTWVLTSGLASGSAFPIGTNVVTWTATDAAGNTATCSFNVVVIDGQLPVISAQPTNRTACVGTNATFSVTSSNVVTYQWQQWNGTAWVNIAGANASTYTVNSVTTAMNTNTFRVVINGLCTSNIISNAATLFVNTNPVITLSSSKPPFLQPGQFLDITATGIPQSGSFVWLFNGVVIPGATTNTLTNLGVDDFGSYSVRYTDANGCITTSAVLVLTGMSSENLWVYPNPNFGSFQVRFFNSNPENATVRVWNSSGVKVYQKTLTTTLPYTMIDIDLGSVVANGVYTVELVNQAGERIGAKQVIVRPN
jgi:hypothetical protein